MDIAGANPLVPHAPDIDLSLTLLIGVDGSLHGSLSGDGFPSAEVFVVGPVPYGARMLMTFSTSYGSLSGPALALPGGGTSYMGGF